LSSRASSNRAWADSMAATQLFPEAGEFGEAFAHGVRLGLEGVNLVLAFEHGIRRLVRGAAVENALAGEEFAVQRDDRGAAQLREDPKCGFEVRHEHGVIDEALHDASAPRPGP
jgi:hypothetical protein